MTCGMKAQPTASAPAAPETHHGSLTDFRSRIDALDDHIIALMRERLEIVKQVRTLKQSQGQTGLFIRSGREGSMIERIVSIFRHGEFCPAAAATIWRQIIGASTCVESPMQVSAYYAKDCQHLLWLAREHFGTGIPIRTTAKSGQVIADLRDGKASIGLLTLPDETDPWWLLLAQDGMPRIFARLPGVVTDNLPKGLAHALAVGTLEPEASGRDESYFAISLDDALSLSRLQNVLTEAGVNILSTLVHQQGAVRHVLLRAEGFATLANPAIAQAQDALPQARIWWLGAHPVPVTL